MPFFSSLKTIRTSRGGVKSLLARVSEMIGYHFSHRSLAFSAHSLMSGTSSYSTTIFALSCDISEIRTAATTLIRPPLTCLDTGTLWNHHRFSDARGARREGPERLAELREAIAVGD